MFDEEPIAHHPELSEQLGSDDGEILQNIGYKSNKNREIMKSSHKDRHQIKKGLSQHEEKKRRILDESDSESKLRRLSEKGSRKFLQRQGSFGAQDGGMGKNIMMMQNTSFGSSNNNKKRKLFTASDGSIDKSSTKSFKLSRMSDWSGEHVENLRIRANVNSQQVLGVLTAEYSFKGEKAKDLSFKAGDKISVLKVRDKEWWQGMTEDGKKG